MKKTLAIVLALVMVLCMIPAMSAGSTTEYKSEAYKLTVFEVLNNKDGSYMEGLWQKLGSTNSGTSVEVKYDYEKQVADTTDKWAEDRKMAILRIDGWNDAFKSLKGGDWNVTVDNNEINVGTAAYKAQCGVILDASDNFQYVQFPVELTKAGYSDTYLVTLTYTAKNGDVTTQTAKISVKMVNTAGYKAEKTASIVDIKSKTTNVDTYIVAGRIYLDYVADKDDAPAKAEVEVTFADENKAPFTAITYAYTPKNADNLKVKAKNIIVKGDTGADDYLGNKLASSAAKYEITGEASKVVFELETASAFYYTDKYEIVTRYGIKEEDPKGIYFAETTKTIHMDETYAPVVLGVATGKKVAATILPGNNTAKQVIDIIDGTKVLGTREGVAYITAEYQAAGQATKYTASSMKIVVTLPGTSIPPVAAEPTVYYVSCRNLNVRRTAGTTYKAVGMVHRGDALQVVEIANGWAKLADGTYVCEKYLYKK